MHIELERDAGTVRLYMADSDAQFNDFEEDSFVDQINAAIDMAIEATKCESKEVGK